MTTQHQSTDKTPDHNEDGSETRDRYYHRHVWPHSELPSVMLRVSVGDVSVGLDFSPAQARHLAARLVEAAEQIEAR